MDDAAADVVADMEMVLLAAALVVRIAVVGHYSTFVDSAAAVRAAGHTCDVVHVRKGKPPKLESSTEGYGTRLAGIVAKTSGPPP